MTDSSLSGWSGVLLPDSISGAGSKKQCRLSILARAKKQSNYYNTTDITKQCPALVDKVPIVSSSQASPHKRSWSSVSNTKPSQYQHSQANQISQQTQSLVSNPRHRLVSRSNNFHYTLGRTLAFNLWSLPQQRNNKLKDSIFSISRPLSSGVNLLSPHGRYGTPCTFLPPVPLMELLAHLQTYRGKGVLITPYLLDQGGPLFS